MSSGVAAGTVYKRLFKEKSLNTKDEFIQLSCAGGEDEMLRWIATLRGPPGSLYQNYLFDIEIRIPENYPIVPPTLMFLTKIYHPNIHFETGEVCIDILKKDWTPAWSLQSACRAVLSILSDPNPNSPLNCDAGNMLRAEDHSAYASMVHMVNHEFATLLPYSV